MYCKSVNDEISIPKELADVFESLAAAIYLDSDQDLMTVWDVYSNLAKPFLGNFVITNIHDLIILKTVKILTSKPLLVFLSLDKVLNDDSITSRELQDED